MTPNNTYGSPMQALSQKVAYTGTAGTITNATPTNTACVRVIATTDCFIEITAAGTAAVADTGLYLPALVPEYFAAGGAVKVSAIQVANGGTIYVTPFA